MSKLFSHSTFGDLKIKNRGVYTFVLYLNNLCVLCESVYNVRHGIWTECLFIRVLFLVRILAKSLKQTVLLEVFMGLNLVQV